MIKKSKNAQKIKECSKIQKLLINFDKLFENPKSLQKIEKHLVTFSKNI